MSINVESAIIPGFGMVTDFGLSGTNCFRAHVSATNIENGLVLNPTLKTPSRSKLKGRLEKFPDVLFDLNLM